jgi:hypothetical protein
MLRTSVFAFAALAAFALAPVRAAEDAATPNDMARFLAGIPAPAGSPLAA